MHYLHNIKEQLCEELEELSRKEISHSDLEFVHKLTDTVKNIDKIIMLEEGGGYSGNYRGGSYSDGRMWDGRNDRRNGDNRQGGYSGRRGGRGGYSRDGAKDDMIEELEESMNETDNPKIRDIMNHCIKILKEM